MKIHFESFSNGGNTVFTLCLNPQQNHSGYIIRFGVFGNPVVFVQVRSPTHGHRQRLMLRFDPMSRHSPGSSVPLSISSIALWS